MADVAGVCVCVCVCMPCLRPVCVRGTWPACVKGMVDVAAVCAKARLGTSWMQESHAAHSYI